MIFSGTKKSANRYYRGPKSDHFDGQLFFNPGGSALPGFRDILKWRFQSKRARWPARFDSPFSPSLPSQRVGRDEMKVTMIGHASMLIQVAGVNILTDPVFAERASPFTFAGPRRVAEPGVRFDDLPPIDAVLVTHNHYDHLDITSLKRLQFRHRPQFVTPLGNDRIIHPKIPDAEISILDWDDHAMLSGGLKVTAEPCHHWSARGIRDRRMALWAAFVIETPAGAIYHIGDTAFFSGRNYRAAAAKYGGFRLANLPIGAYEPRFFMESAHQNPQEAVKGMKLANAAYAVGHHFGTFQLTDEAIDAPLKALEEALIEEGIETGRFRPLLPGQSFDVPPLR
ncbi:MBL fold metallo-hydrolase [Martelella alba]|uniref:MBL fold metallo-hydrolase n=1 Tax=Martelella alba TaxID=2590451 RepID=A0A506UC25_9HYPH|nr:MBL fold metallo-hydrolase [Martelella alba]TPW30956.1 MBL fold metallo-hydrolase [Martelella alba]